MKKKKNNFNETIKFLNQIQRRIQHPHNIQDGNLPDINPRPKYIN